jgi:hypothetical protein
MTIKNWNKLIGEKVNILGSDFIINNLKDDELKYEASFFDLYTSEKIFDVILHKKKEWFDLRCEFHLDTIPLINNQNIRAVLRKKDVMTIHSFINTICRILQKNTIITTYFSLIGESQKYNKNKNKLKIVNGSGTYGPHTKGLILKN